VLALEKVCQLLRSCLCFLLNLLFYFSDSTLHGERHAAAGDLPRIKALARIVFLKFSAHPISHNVHKMPPTLKTSSAVFASSDFVHEPSRRAELHFAPGR